MEIQELKRKLKPGTVLRNKVGTEVDVVYIVENKFLFRHKSGKKIFEEPLSRLLNSINEGNITIEKFKSHKNRLLSV